MLYNCKWKTPKNAQITTQLHSSHTLLKILQASLQQYMNHELPDVYYYMW